MRSGVEDEAETPEGETAPGARARAGPFEVRAWPAGATCMETRRAHKQARTRGVDRDTTGGTRCAGPCRSDFGGEFDPGSGSTLAACLMHASRTGWSSDRLRGGRVRNTWAIYLEEGDSFRKREVIPHELMRRVGRMRKGATRLERSLRPISWLVGSRLTKAMIGSWSERMASHTGTETRPRLLREAAARNFPQWAQA